MPQYNEFMCIDRQKDANGNIFGYTLANEAGVKLNIDPDKLKKAIITKQIYVTNLKLTTDCRLIIKKNSLKLHKSNGNKIISVSKVPTYTITKKLVIEVLKDFRNINELKFQSNRNLDKLLEKAILLNFKADYINKHTLRLVRSIQGESGKNAVDVIVVCDGIWVLNADSQDFLNPELDKYKYNRAFSAPKKVNISKVKFATHCIDSIFSGACTDELEMHGMNFEVITSLEYAFINANIGKLDLSNILMKNLEGMYCAFRECHIENLILDGFSAPKLEGMDNTFEYARIENISMKNLRAPKLESIEDMFSAANIGNDVLDLSWMTSRNINDISRAFAYLKAKTLDISNLDTRNILRQSDTDYYMRDLFHKCEIDTVIVGENFTAFSKLPNCNVIYK